MIDALFNQSTYVAAKQMLDVTALRHEAIASNLTHVETPNYKRIDVSPAFESQLRQLIARGESSSMASTRPTLAQDATAVASRLDGNSVQLEDELLRMNKNALAHSLETQLVTGSLLRLRLAISGRP
jgi:flagellar basal-body rod protein FlgB